MDRKGIITNKGVLIRRECDESMARKKGYLPCEQKCEKCLACIEIFEGGKREHVTKYREYHREQIGKSI